MSACAAPIGHSNVTSFKEFLQNNSCLKGLRRISFSNMIYFIGKLNSIENTFDALKQFCLTKSMIFARDINFPTYYVR